MKYLQTPRQPHQIYKKVALEDWQQENGYLIFLFYTYKEESEEVEFRYDPKRHD